MSPSMAAFLAILINVGTVMGDESATAIKPPHRIFQHGDITLGGIFNLQSATSKQRDVLTYLSCEDSYNSNVFLTEAMIYALEQINSDPQILPNITLGYNIQGTCENSVQNMLFGLDSYIDTYALASTREPSDCLSFNTSAISPMAAIIGPATSSGSASVASLFRLQSLPVISYASSDPELSAKRRFPTFFRTIYSNAQQAAALADLVEHLNWTYLAVVGSDDSLGRQGVYQFKRAIWQKEKTCISLEKYLQEVDNPRSVVESLRTSTQANSNASINVTLLFMDWNSAYSILKEADKQNLTHMTWVGVDQWTSNMNMTSEAQLEGGVGVMPPAWSHGTIATQFPTDKPYSFAYYMSNTTTLQRRLYGYDGNPWLLSFFCQYCNVLLNRTERCSPEYATSDLCLSKLNYHNIILTNHRVVNVMQAVYAVAYALHDLNEKNKIVSRNGQLSFNYTELIEALYRVNFSRDNLRVKFTKDGDLDNATMAIHSYHKEEENGNIYTKDTLVGYWHENGTTANDRFQLDYNKIVWKFGSKPVSVCNALCSPGTRVVYGPSKCCWSCEPCTTHEYSNETHSEKCYKCQDHTHANIQKSKCVDNWERWICLQDGIGITSLVFAGIGWAAVLISTVVVVINRTHRCLQSETTLKAITLLSCLFGYFNVVFWIVQPTDTNCTIRRLGLLLIAMTHCLRVFFISPIGRLLATRTATYLHLNQRFAVEISFSLHLLVAGLIHYGLIYPFPFNVFKSDVFGSDDVNGEKIVSFLDCHFDNQVNTAIILIISILHPTIYWLSAVISCYRGREKAPKRQRISSGTPPTVTVDDNRLVLFVSYFVSLVILATLPIYATSTDPYLHNFILLVVVFVCNSLVLLFFIAPRLYKIYFKREFAAMGHLFFVDTSISAK